VVRRGVLTVANAGDSRCVLCRGGAALDMSSDHKPDLPEEADRIEEVPGSKCCLLPVWRVLAWACPSLAIVVGLSFSPSCTPHGLRLVCVSKQAKPSIIFVLVLQAGGFVRNGRTCGNLSLSRALGDFEFKRNSALPCSSSLLSQAT
jgi:Protein phosphatase 2C